MLSDQTFTERPFLIVGKELFLQDPKAPGPVTPSRLSYGRVFALRESERLRVRWDFYYLRIEDEPPEIWDVLESFGAPITLIQVSLPSPRSVKDVQATFNACDYCYALELERRFRLQGKKVRSNTDPDEFLASLALAATSLNPHSLD